MLFTLAILACNTSTPPAPGEPREAPMNPAAEGTDVWCPAEPRPLAGTWLAPKGDGPFPTALILVGARPWNRWGDAPDAPWGHYRDIAEALVAGGAAVLVFDKGGTGQTGGTTVNLSARVTEARAAVSCALAQPGADPQRFSLVGHSQGSVVATHATVKGVPTQGLVLLSPLVEVDVLAALPDGLQLTLVRGELDGADVDEKRLQVLSARRLQTRHAVIPNADHLLLDAAARVPRAEDPETAVHPAALHVIVDAVTSLGRAEP